MSNTSRSDKFVYADYASFSPVDKDVLSAMLPYYEDGHANPSSLHACGRQAKRVLEDARKRIADVLSVDVAELVFTGSGTEANNLALYGVAHAYRHHGMHIIVSSIEHPSILEAAKRLNNEGFAVSYAPVTAEGVLDVDACMSLVTDGTTLISVMYVNNEIGTVQPIEELSKRLHALGGGRPFLHIDACQAANVFSLVSLVRYADLVTLNSTKVSGPAGVGLLRVRKGVVVESLIVGGEQERGLRAGTENIPLIVGFSLALSKAQSMWKEEHERLRSLRSYFVEGLRTRIPSIRIHGREGKQSPSIVHVTVPHIEGEAMLLMLDDRNICASTGSACASMNIAASHVLTAIGQDPDTMHGSLRFSFGRGTSKEDIDRILEAFPAITSQLVAITALTLRRP